MRKSTKGCHHSQETSLRGGRAQRDRLSSYFFLPRLRLRIMEMVAEHSLSSSSFFFSLCSSWLFCSSSDEAWKPSS